MSREDHTHSRPHSRRSLNRSLTSSRGGESSESGSELDLLSLSYSSVSSRGSTGSGCGLGAWQPVRQRLEELRMKYQSMLEEVGGHFRTHVSSELILKKLRLAPPELKHLRAFASVRDCEGIFSLTLHFPANPTPIPP